jgi:hypothetical protein
MDTNHTLWIHAIKISHSHQEYTVDPCKKIQIEMT